MRIDKYDPKVGGFRAPLAADRAATATGGANGIGVGLDVNGRVVPGAGVTGIKGILVLTQDKKAGDIVDVMTAGEMVECAGFAAGANIVALEATGVLSDGEADATHRLMGFTVEATRMVVRVTNTLAFTAN